MSKLIVVVTSFAESHLIKHLIPNIINTLSPDKIVISEGLMKNGPENKKTLSVDFKHRWCFENTNAGFDWTDTVAICKDYGELVHYQWNLYDMDNAVDAYKCSISNCFTKTSIPEIGDVVICLEADSFLLESDSKIIKNSLDGLKIGTGLSVKYVDFLETQYYTECINTLYPKYRRFAYKFDNIDNYLEAMSTGFMSQQYPKLVKTNEYYIRHYCWWRPQPWRQLRYELIWRKDPQYWEDFEKGLQEIRHLSEGFKPNYLNEFHNKILIRPSRQDEGRWAQFIDIEHPKAIQSHPNFI
jgi:hypothetical protein